MNEKHIPNPTGKGGFGDNPQNSAKGRWKGEDSISHQYNKLLRMTVDEIQAWTEKNPTDKRTLAQDIAFNAILKARKELSYLREVTDRTEGKPMQYSEIQAKVDTSEGLSEETIAKMDEMYEKNNSRSGE
ncbi:MAG: hypothetical protein H8D23_21545 [Candidatus Brocadiales bacterium]|nr:hypothetical protein [Candidatus Brocadiales bacterium]